LEDVYKINLLGSLKHGIDPSAAKKALSDLFKVSPEIVKTYLDGKKRIVKQGLSLGEAKKYQAILNRAGAISEIDVVLDRRILVDSSVFDNLRESNANPHPAIEALSSANTAAAEPDAVYQKRPTHNDPVSNFLQSAGFEFDMGRFSPAIFSGPVCVTATDPGGARIGAIESTQPILGRALTLLATVISAFALQILGLVFLTAKFSTAAFVTPLMILIFLMSLVFLPKIFRVKKVIQVIVSAQGKQKQICRFREKKWGWPFTREIIVEDDSNKPIARVKKNQLFLTYACTAQSGETVYSADPDMNIEDSIVYLGDSAREELFTVAALVINGFEKFKSVAKFLNTWGRISKEKATTIFDDQGSVAAELSIYRSSLKKHRHFALRIRDGASSNADRRILLAFGLLLAGL